MTLKLTHRVVLMPVLSCIAFATIVATTLLLSLKNREALSAIETGYIPAVDLAHDLDAKLTVLQRCIADAVADEDEEQFEVAARLRLDFLTQLGRARQGMETDLADVDLIEQEFEQYYGEATAAARQLFIGQRQEQLPNLLQEMTRRNNRIRALLQAYADHRRNELLRSTWEAQATLARSTRRIALVSAVCLLLLSALSWGAVRSIVRPIASLGAATERIGRGELDHRVAVASRDEIGALAAAFNRMAEELGRSHAEREEALRALARANEELEQRVRERTVQLAAANKELEAFAYSVSHDLRAPLRGIDGFSLALLEEYDGRLDDAGRDYLQRIRRGCVRMGALIDDLLQLSRLTRAQMRHERVDLSALAHAVLAELREADPERQVECVVAPGVVVEGDGALLRAALANLLGNAWKFTRRAERARIEFGISGEDRTRVFFVRDNGAGFDMRYVDKLFGVFQRLHADKDFEGTGIGLATVQRIVHRHGGRIWAESAPGEGATFSFTLEEARA